MSLSSDDLANYLFKVSLGVGNTDETKKYFEEWHHNFHGARQLLPTRWATLEFPVSFTMRSAASWARAEFQPISV